MPHMVAIGAQKRQIGQLVREPGLTVWIGLMW